MNLNEWRGIGGITRAPEFRATTGGLTIAELSIACNSTKYDSAARAQVPKTTYVTVQAFGWLADKIVALNLSQGDEVYVMGELDQSEFEKKDGTKERKTRITAVLIDVTRSRSHPPTNPAGSGLQSASQSGSAWEQREPPPNFDEPPF